MHGIRETGIGLPGNLGMHGGSTGFLGTGTTTGGGGGGGLVGTLLGTGIIGSSGQPPPPLTNIGHIRVNKNLLVAWQVGAKLTSRAKKSSTDRTEKEEEGFIMPSDNDTWL